MTVLLSSFLVIIPVILIMLLAINVTEVFDLYLNL
jgi:hypothetical protein